MAASSEAYASGKRPSDAASNAAGAAAGAAFAASSSAFAASCSVSIATSPPPGGPGGPPRGAAGVSDDDAGAAVFMSRAAMDLILRSPCAAGFRGSSSAPFERLELRADLEHAPARRPSAEVRLRGERRVRLALARHLRARAAAMDAASSFSRFAGVSSDGFGVAGASLSSAAAEGSEGSGPGAATAEGSAATSSSSFFFAAASSPGSDGSVEGAFSICANSVADPADPPRM